jgi:hypothetical protein
VLGSCAAGWLNGWQGGVVHVCSGQPRLKACASWWRGAGPQRLALLPSGCLAGCRFHQALRQPTRRLPLPAPRRRWCSLAAPRWASRWGRPPPPTSSRAPSSWAASRQWWCARAQVCGRAGGRAPLPRLAGACRVHCSGSSSSKCTGLCAPLAVSVAPGVVVMPGLVPCSCAAAGAPGPAAGA